MTELVGDEVARRSPPARLTVTVAVPTAGPPIVVQGHRALLARVLGNLLDNAERHADTAIAVTLAHATDHQAAVLDVHDDGPGIAPEDQHRVFERFTRLDDARARDTGGTGLGLAIAHRITTSHAGTLALTPTTHGTLFTARLPTTTGERDSNRDPSQRHP